MNNITEYITNNTIRLEVSHRGGGIEIDASEYLKIDGAKITAYQNYLGCGMTGSIASDRNFETKDKRKLARADKLAEALKRYFYNASNDLVQDYDEWASSDSYESQQNRPNSAY